VLLTIKRGNRVNVAQVHIVVFAVTGHFRRPGFTGARAIELNMIVYQFRQRRRLLHPHCLQCRAECCPFVYKLD